MTGARGCGLGGWLGVWGVGALAAWRLTCVAGGRAGVGGCGWGGVQHKLSVQERLEAAEAACLAAQHRIATS